MHSAKGAAVGEENKGKHKCLLRGAHKFACRVECQGQRIQREEKEDRYLKSFANKILREIFQQAGRKDVKNKINSEFDVVLTVHRR
jgi:hypothetical protein